MARRDVRGSYRRGLRRCSSAQKGNARASIDGRATVQTLTSFFFIPSQSGEPIGQVIIFDVEKVIILKGPQKVGKSSTLRSLIDLLLAIPGHNLLYLSHVNLMSDISQGKDCFAVIETNGKRIGVITCGDPGCEIVVAGYRQTCLKMKCDILVAASRSYNKNGSVFSGTYNFAIAQKALLIVTTPFIIHNLPNIIQQWELI